MPSFDSIKTTKSWYWFFKSETNLPGNSSWFYICFCVRNKTHDVLNWYFMVCIGLFKNNKKKELVYSVKCTQIANYNNYKELQCNMYPRVQITIFSMFGLTFLAWPWLFEEPCPHIVYNMYITTFFPLLVQNCVRKDHRAGWLVAKRKTIS